MSDFVNDVKVYLATEYALKVDDYPAFRKTVDNIAVEMGLPTDSMNIKHPAFIEAVRRAGGQMPVTTFPADEPIVSMLEHQGLIWVATSKRVFKYVGNRFEPVSFRIAPSK